MRIGNFVRLNSGSPILMVVDCEAAHVTLAWLDLIGKVREKRFPSACLHRVSPASAVAGEQVGKSLS